MIDTYEKFAKNYQQEYEQVIKRFNLVSTLRLIVGLLICVFLYLTFRSDDNWYLAIAGILFLLFLFFVKKHIRLNWTKKIKGNLVKINHDEISFLNDQSIPFDDGVEYIDTKHLFSYDLDLFGPHSLYQHLNRTASYIGKSRLAEQLTSEASDAEIVSNQRAIEELASKILWRHDLHSLAMTLDNDKENYKKLLQWSRTSSEPLSGFIKIICYLLPALFVLSCVLQFFVDMPLLGSIAKLCFFLNLVVLGTQYKRIKAEIIDSHKIGDIIKRYSLIIEMIEDEKFESQHLKDLQGGLSQEENASIHIKKLGGLFSNMESILNGVGAILFNGVALFHLHILSSLLQWKKAHGSHIEKWLGLIGEFEMLSSLANFSYNNPGYIFPTLNQDFEIDMQELGHPLIQEKIRVCNDVNLNKSNFTILTGSNMSGKSTFLRTLGLNMVLAKAGSVVCAKKASIHPLPILISMRQTDSLVDSESYFYAEIKRLKLIIDKLSEQSSFILLDEILRGTNSDDKRQGTIEVIKKLIDKEAIGAIATHDLVVCETTKEYPNKLTNKCFEVEIVEDNLHFDYKLRDGVCKNKNASFLMRKMDII